MKNFTELRENNTQAVKDILSYLKTPIHRKEVTDAISKAKSESDWNKLTSDLIQDAVWSGHARHIMNDTSTRLRNLVKDKLKNGQF